MQTVARNNIDTSDTSDLLELCDKNQQNLKTKTI